MGCDVNREKVDELYEKALKVKPPLVDLEESEGEDIGITLEQYAQMVDLYVNESDPVDGVISTIQETYDPEETGKVKYQDLIKFMEEYNWLEAEKESVEKVLQEYRETNDLVDYSKAMKNLIQ